MNPFSFKAWIRNGLQVAGITCLAILFCLILIGCLPQPYEPAGPVASGAMIGEEFYFLATPALGADVEQVWDDYHRAHGHTAKGTAIEHTGVQIRVVLYPSPGVAMIKPEALTLYLHHLGVMSLTPAKPDIPPGRIAAEAEPPTHGGGQTN